MSQPVRHEFQAEVRQLLDLMVHSLYSDKDIFLRELISNASDAIDKLRFESLTSEGLAAAEPQIRLEPDAEKRTLAIADTGIGMTREEVVANIGTIAKSGTKEFLKSLRDAPKGEALPPELIGQFGVGFYAAFMVADRIELVTRKAGATTATRWESTGDGAYTVEDGERPEVGTTITLHLKPADPEHGLRDYTSDAVVDDIVKKYSDFVAYPIVRRLGSSADGSSGASPGRSDKTLNSMKAIWDRPKAEVSDAEYKEFYRHLTHDWTDPLRTIPVKMEGTIEAYALLYLPEKAPFDLYSPEMKRGVQLYVKRVFVMDECKELMPPHLRWVKGVVDAHDLSLNVSREILQKDRQIQVIKKQLVKKVLGTLEEMKRDAADDYLKFWAGFGPALKEGLVAYDVQDKDKLLDLVIAPSTRDPNGKLVSLDDYVGRMKEGQEAIYFLTGPSKDAVAKSPLLEAVVAKGYEVLLFSDPIDELWLERAPRYKDKPLQSIGKGDVALGTAEERKQAESAIEEKSRELSDLLTCLRVHLQEDVKEVRLSNRLTSSAACLVADEHDLSPRVQRMLEQLGQPAPKSKPILELNPAHALIPKLQVVFAEDSSDVRLALYARLLLGQAHLADSGHLPDPDAFGKALADLMIRAV
ncbi:MAG: molecular chaperone HtpG [Deltaproteobacteria bacterium]|nr:molecular chaperone HtpG [Deltaproteobacteria bacterium]